MKPCGELRADDDFFGNYGELYHAAAGRGTLDFNAPTSGTWSAIAIYQDPALTAGRTAGIQASAARPFN